jgi:BASS family bile acid:Na+ symporter
MTPLDPLVDLAVPALVWLLMLTVGLELTPGDLRRVVVYPKAVLVATLGQLLLLPAIAVALIWALRPEPTVAAGMILLAASPGGALSNVYTYLARANLALSVTLTALSTLLALISMPLLTAAGIALFLDRQDAIPVPFARMVGQLVLLMVLPLSLGMALRHGWPGLVHHAGRWLRRLSLLGLAILVGAILYAERADLADGTGPMVTPALVFSVTAMLTGWVLGWLVGLNRRDRFTLLLEFGVRNLALVALIGITVFGRVELVLFATLFLVVEMPIALLLTGLHGRRAGPTDTVELAGRGSGSPSHDRETSARVR